MYGMVLTQIIRRLIIISVVVVFSTSCASYRTIQIEVLRPAQIQVEAGKKIALLDRNIHRKDGPIVFQDKTEEAGLIKDFARGMNYVLVEMNYDTIIPLPGHKRVEIGKGLCPFPLPMDTILTLGNQYLADYIVSLELQYYVLGRYTIECKWGIRLYKWGESEPLDFIVMSNVIDQPVYPDDSKYLLEAIRGAFWDEGAAYARRIIPYWEETERRVYHHGKILRLGDVLWQNGNTEEAMKLWKAAYEKSDKTAIPAGINMAWALENKGDFDSALKYLQEVEKLAKHEKVREDISVYIRKYIKNIKLRIEQRDILEQQMDSLEI